MYDTSGSAVVNQEFSNHPKRECDFTVIFFQSCLHSQVLTSTDDGNKLSLVFLLSIITVIKNTVFVKQPMHMLVYAVIC